MLECFALYLLLDLNLSGWKAAGHMYFKTSDNLLNIPFITDLL